MPSIHTAEYSDYNTIDGTAPGRWNGSSPVNATLPDTAAALEAAIRIEDNLRKTFDRCMEMVDTWSQLRSYYEGPDQDIVYTAFENRLEKISALKLAGERLLEAFGLLDSTLETSVAGRHDEYVQWAGPYSAECREHEPELGEWCRGGIPTAHALWCRLGIDERDEDQVEKAEQILDTFNRLKSERLENYQVASQVVRDINEARRAVTDTLNEMKCSSWSPFASRRATRPLTWCSRRRTWRRCSAIPRCSRVWNSAATPSVKRLSNGLPVSSGRTGPAGPTVT